MYMYMYLVIVLEGLVVVLLDMECPGQLVAALGLHWFHFCKAMKSQVLDFSVVLVGREKEREGGKREREYRFSWCITKSETEV